MMKNTVYIFTGAGLFLLLIVLMISRSRSDFNTYEPVELEELEIPTAYGLPVDDFRISEGKINSGESLSVILARYGVTARTVDSLVQASDGLFDIRTIRAGNTFKAFLSPDSTAQRLCHFVYERNAVDYVVFTFCDSVSVRTDSKEVTAIRRVAEATIRTSLWNAMIESGQSPSLAMTLSDVYAWTIDFFGLQTGDNFKVVYDELFVDTLRIGHGNIWGAWFEQNGKKYWAIPFDQNGKIEFWDENGNSLRKNMLKAPLSYSRISSTFSNSRLHPVLKIRRPHHGVDYAAPAGTPVYAVADGAVTQRGWGGGGGNTVKIKHARGLESGYLHLSRFAEGLAVGKRVTQGQLIGYVGSTGISTGPHLDFRIWQNGKPIDPLKVPTEPAEPIEDINRACFMQVQALVIGALEGSIDPDSIRLFGPQHSDTPGEMVVADSLVGASTEES